MSIESIWEQAPGECTQQNNVVQDAPYHEECSGDRTYLKKRNAAESPKGIHSHRAPGEPYSRMPFKYSKFTHMVEKL